MPGRAGTRRTPQLSPTPGCPHPRLGTAAGVPTLSLPRPTTRPGTTCSLHPKRSKTQPRRDARWALAVSQPGGTTSNPPALARHPKGGTRTRLPEPTGSARSKGRWFWKTFVPLLDVMKPAKEHETACRGWEHPGLYEECCRIPACYGKARCAPPPRTRPCRVFFFS